MHQKTSFHFSDTMLYWNYSENDVCQLSGMKESLIRSMSAVHRLELKFLHRSPEEILTGKCAHGFIQRSPRACWLLPVYALAAGSAAQRCFLQHIVCYYRVAFTNYWQIELPK